LTHPFYGDFALAFGVEIPYYFPAGGISGANATMDGISGIYGGIGTTPGQKIGELEHRQGMGKLGFKMDDPDRPMSADEIKKTTFRDLILGGVGEVNMLQKNADGAVEKMMCGGEIGMAEVLTAVQKADIAFKMMMQIRNKLVAAYQEIQNMRV
jgi:flagellar hook-basal body complex protein FliE